ncbi:MAG: DUF2804 domain-containing protein [Endozoicomonas sp. (ex Botrylloides leachii)]|nr:DUF2804 domain-containing protein [Endozoicomonas sp. (ex Botrylloides leachii)]
MHHYKREILPSPTEAVTAGVCNFGTFSSEIKKINLLETRRPLGLPLPTKLNNFRLKEWEAIQLLCEHWFFCIAVYNTKTIGTAIIMAFNRQTERMYVYQHKVPFWKLTTPSGLTDSHYYYHSPHLTLDIKNQLQTHKVTVSFSANHFKNQPNLQGTFCGHYLTEPIVTISPLGDNRPLYSHKALMTAEGYVYINNKKFNYASEHTCMIMDDHKGFYPYTMQYDWATALGRGSEGILQGFNLTNNQVKDQEQFNENCLWFDGKMYPLPPISIVRPQGVQGKWQIKDSYKLIDLTFTPRADVLNYLNLGLIKTRYHGPTGLFSGFIKTVDGPTVCFDGFVGMGEKKYIRM